MKQIVFTQVNIKPDYEPNFSEEKFSVNKPDAESGTLTVMKVKKTDEGLYFCGVAQHSDKTTHGRLTKTPAQHHNCTNVSTLTEGETAASQNAQ